MSTQAAKTLRPSPVRWSRPEPTWEEIASTSPEMVATVRRYLADLGASLKPASVKAAEVALRQFAGRVTQADPRCRSVASIGRHHVEDYLVWLRARPGPQWGDTVSLTTVDHRVGLIVKFFERVLSWDYADASPTIPIGARDRPKLVRPSRAGRKARVTKVAPVAKTRPRRVGGAVPEITWDEVASRAPQMATTMNAYLDQLAVSARPATVVGADKVLRLFAGRVSAADAGCRCVAAIGRPHIEDYKAWLAARPGTKAPRLSSTTIRVSLGTLRTFFERVIEWGYADAPVRVPVYGDDLPRADDALPRFLDDPTAAKFMATLATDPNRRRRLVVELLARTGMRVGELCDSTTTPWSASATPSGCASRWASCTTTATCPCTRCSSSSSATTGRDEERHRRAASSSATTAVPSTGVPSAATLRRSPSAPGSAMSIPTSCATPWPPRPSTEA